MYPAGTWTKGVTDVINLDAVYDSTGLESNMYTALFVEQGQLAVQRCLSTQELTIPVQVSGQTGSSVLIEYLGVDGAGGAAAGGPKQVAPKPSSK